MSDNTRDKRRMKAILVATATTAFVLSPFLSGAFGGFEPDQFPVPQDRPPVQPAGYAFSIWGVIYLWLLVHAGAGLFARGDDADWDRGRWPLIASLTVGAAWIAVAQVSPLWATVLIWVMLVTAVAALAQAPRRAPWLAGAPLGLYAGWLTAASFVSIGLVGAGYGIGPDSLGWAWIALALALVAAIAVQLRLAQTPFYGLAVAWGVAAIAARNWGDNWTLAVTAAVAALLLLSAAGSRLRDLR